MEIYQDGVRVFCIPEDSRCTADEENRSPEDIWECPIGCDTCSGDCQYYTEGD